MNNLLRTAPAALAAVCLCFCGSSAALAVDDIDAEFDYASKLITEGFPQYAEIVVQRIVAAHPEVEDRAEVIRAESLVARRQFYEAGQIVAKMPQDSPKAWAIKLAMADAYYQVGEYEKCIAIYSEFFEKHGKTVPTDPDLLRFFGESAYKFAQMLVDQDLPGRAADIYDLVLETISDRDMVRQIKLEQAELLLRAAAHLTGDELQAVTKKAIDNCNEVIWGGMDLWFGRAVTCLAQAEIVAGRKDEAADLLDANLPMLRNVDELLREAEVPMSESPLAGARFLLGDLYTEEADILTGSEERRELEALHYFRRAFAELQSVWRLIVAVNKREAAYLKRYEDKTVDDLPGTPEERQAPFQQIDAAMSDFHSLLEGGGGADGWTLGAREKANELLNDVNKTREEIQNYDRAIGAQPGKEMEMGPRFAGNVLIERGRFFLTDEGQRKEEAVKLYVKGLTEYYNVFAGYPGSSWSGDASKKVSVLKDKLQALTGKVVDIVTSDGGRRKIGLVMISEGQSHFQRQEYDKAAEAFLKGLNDYHDGPKAVAALANLMESYAKLGDKLFVKMTATFMAERFKEEPAAPQSLLRMGRYYYDQEDRTMYHYLYELYLREFKDHHVAPTILYMLGEQQWKVEDYDGAIQYYQRVIDTYPQGAESLKALDRIGWSHYLSERYAEAAKAFEGVVANAYPGNMKAQAKLCLADSYRQIDEHLLALKHYRELEKWLAEGGSHYQRTADMRTHYANIMEQAVFFQGHCLSQVTEPKEKLPAFREAAVKLYRDFVERFPDSNLAPTALSSMGAVLLAAENAEEAAKVYDELAGRYPKSEAGENARFAMIRSLINIGHLTKAKAELEKMAASAGQYPPGHFLKIGQLMMDEEQYDAAVMALEQVLSLLAGSTSPSKEQAGMEQRALIGLGRANYALERYDETVKHVNRLVERYPTSGLFYEARFLLGRAYKAQDRPAEAIEVLRDVFKRAADQHLINRATLELAELQLAQEQTAEALASYQRIVLLVSPEDPKSRPLLEESLIRSGRIFIDMQKWTQANETADTYLALFPSGKHIVEIRGIKQRALGRLMLEEGV